MANKVAGYSSNQPPVYVEPRDNRHTDRSEEDALETNVLADMQEPRHDYMPASGHHYPPSTPNPLSAYLASFLEATVSLSVQIGGSLWNKSSVIIIGAGVAGAVHYLASGYNPALGAATDTAFAGTVALAKYVGMAFFLKAALEPIHKGYTSEINSNNIRTAAARKEWINNHVVSYLTPMALAWIVAYATGLPVKLLQGTGYMVGTFGLIKVLDKAYNMGLERYQQWASKSERPIRD